MIEDYWKEAFGRDVVKNEHGFISYKIEGELCYIVDVYVKPEMRVSKYASKLANLVSEIAYEKGCKTLIGTVNLKSSDPTRSMKVLLGYGFSLHSQDQFASVLVKDIKEDLWQK